MKGDGEDMGGVIYTRILPLLAGRQILPYLTFWDFSMIVTRFSSPFPFPCVGNLADAKPYFGISVP